ncbi:MAG: hypothetical protein NVS2B7_01300 [Herpetosiphon sp.]
MQRSHCTGHMALEKLGQPLDRQFLAISYRCGLVQPSILLHGHSFGRSLRDVNAILLEYVSSHDGFMYFVGTIVDPGPTLVTIPKR